MVCETAMQTEAFALSELRDGLAATCRDGNHWCCDSDFLALTGLSLEQFRSQLKKWWGNPELWLEIIATEVARHLGTKVGLEGALGHDWTCAVDSWIDETFACGTSTMSCPLPRPMMATKAIPLAQSVLKRIDNSTRPHAQPAPKTRTLAVCDFCGNRYSQRLGQCPVCFPRACDTKVVEMKAAATGHDEWQGSRPRSIDSVPWEQVSAVKWCHGGSGGVVLAKIAEEVVCVKPCKIGEVFAHRVAAAIGVAAVHTRVVAPLSEEHLALNNHISKIAPALGETDYLPIRKILRSRDGLGGVCVIQYSDGVCMMGVAANAYLLEHTQDMILWNALGRLAAFDMLINNFDRLPLAWKNDGNLSNVMIGSSSDTVVGIDQCITPITHPEGLRDYLSRVHQAVCEARDGSGQAFARVKEAVYINTAIELSAAQLDAVRSGCYGFATEIAAMVDSGELEALLTCIGEELERDFACYGDECKNLNTSYSDLVRATAATMQSLVVNGKTY